MSFKTESAELAEHFRNIVICMQCLGILSQVSGLQGGANSDSRAVAWSTNGTSERCKLLKLQNKVFSLFIKMCFLFVFKICS